MEKRPLLEIFINPNETFVHTFYVVVRALKPLTVVSPQTSLYRQGNYQATPMLSGPPSFVVVLARGKHPFPFRTRQLSLSAPMILQGQPCGKVGRRHILFSSEPYLGLWPGCGELIPLACPGGPCGAAKAMCGAYIDN